MESELGKALALIAGSYSVHQYFFESYALVLHQVSLLSDFYVPAAVIATF